MMHLRVLPLTLRILAKRWMFPAAASLDADETGGTQGHTARVQRL
jgi:hypothetical protein